MNQLTQDQSERIDRAADELVRIIAESCACEGVPALGQNVIAQALVAINRHGPLRSSDAMLAAISGALLAAPPESHMTALKAGSNYLGMRALQILLSGGAA